VDHVYDGFHGFDSSGFFGPYVTPDFLKAELSEAEDVLGDLLGGARHGILDLETIGAAGIAAEALWDNGVQVKGVSQGCGVALLGFTSLLKSLDDRS
jgi:hypothetical protein